MKTNESKNFTGITHDNGGRPFVVNIDDTNRTHIYKQIDHLAFDVKNIFKGEENSSCLLELKDNKGYYFVGTEIFTFTTDEKIIKFVAPIGNSDVPYPYAESENYFYILLDKVSIKKSDLGNNENELDMIDVYSSYYKHEKSLNPKKLKNLKIIEKRII